MSCKRFFSHRPKIGFDTFGRSLCSFGHVEQLNFAFNNLPLSLDKYDLEEAGKVGNVSILSLFVEFERKRGMTTDVVIAFIELALRAAGKHGPWVIFPIHFDVFSSKLR